MIFADKRLLTVFKRFKRFLIVKALVVPSIEEGPPGTVLLREGLLTALLQAASPGAEAKIEVDPECKL